jgi:hypothetical protein
MFVSVVLLGLCGYVLPSTMPGCACREAAKTDSPLDALNADLPSKS